MMTRPVPYKEPKFIDPVRFDRLDLPMYRERPDLTDAEILTNWDLKCNGGLVMLLASRGYAKHLAHFIQKWMEIPEYMPMNLCARVSCVHDAFKQADRMLGSKFKPGSPAAKTADKFRKRMMDFFLQPASVKFGFSDNPETGREWAIKNTVAMSKLMDPVLEAVPEEQATTYITDQEIEALTQYIAGGSYEDGDDGMKDILAETERRIEGRDEDEA